MYTAILPTIPGVFAIYRVIKAAKNWQLSSGEVRVAGSWRRPFSNYWIDPGLLIFLRQAGILNYADYPTV